MISSQPLMSLQQSVSLISSPLDLIYVHSEKGDAHDLRLGSESQLDISLYAHLVPCVIS